MQAAPSRRFALPIRTMTTYREFQAELERIYQQSESDRRRAKAEAFRRIRELVIDYQLEPGVIGLVAWKWDGEPGA